MIGQLITLCETVRGPTREAHGRGRRTETTPGRAIPRLQQFSARESVAPRSAGRNDPIHTIVAAAQKILVVQRSSWYSLDSLNLDQLVARVPMHLVNSRSTEENQDLSRFSVLNS